MSKYKRRIHIDGRNIEGVFRLPCVSGIHKNIFGAIVFDLYSFVMADGSDITAGDGDCLCELYDDRWVVEKE